MLSIFKKYEHINEKGTNNRQTLIRDAYFNVQEGIKSIFERIQ